ncbi:MAG TPA: PQQ-binding-like beta-propeller repeat protein [Verrucomicrobiae bacterium]|nr:PQQ-binding-like beta-propeller repeat protein [Verrucomicrobiae bacterium]
MKNRYEKFSTMIPAALALFCVPLLINAACAAVAESAHNWPQFRGPNSSGVSDDPAPVTWNVESGENIRWQTPIPGLGHASPIIWDDKIYIATAVKPGAKPELKIGLYGDVGSYSEMEAHQWHLLCLQKADGKVLWDKLVLESVPRTKRHTKSTHCNSTPATDGERIAAIFGSEGLFCFDMDGKQLWHKDLGRMDAGWYVQTNTSWGFSSSPLLRDGRIIVQCDVLSEQYLAAFDARDGHQIWRTQRKDVPTFSTPVIAATSERTQIIVSGWKQIAGYDFATGKQLWTLKEGGDIPVASPIVTSDCVILTSAHGRDRPFRAVRLDASGDITPSDLSATNQFVVWCQARKGNYLETPIALGGLVWGDKDGILTCFDAKTGEIVYNERIGQGAEGFTASPVVAGGKLYITGEEGDVFVVPASRTFSVVASNKLGGICLSTPAISDGTLYFRTTEKLIAVGSKK